MYKRIIKISIFFFLFWVLQTFSLCTNPSYKIDNICNDINCYETSNWLVDFANSTSKKIYTNYQEDNIKLKDKLTGIINAYKENYKNVEFSLDWYCSDFDCDDTEDKNYTLEWLLNINSNFKTKIDWVKKEYKNWYNYFFRNYNFVLSSLHEDLFGWKKLFSLRWDVSYNLIEVWVLDNFFRFKNICTDLSCSTTIIKDIQITDNFNYKYIKNWVISSFNLNDYIEHSNVESYNSLDKTSVKAWSWVTINFWFEDKTPTDWCFTKSYRYKIYNSKTKDESKLLLNEQFELRLTNFTISWTLDNYDFIDVDHYWDNVKIKIKEPFIRTLVWNEFYYYEITDLDEWYSTEDRVNYSALEVIPGDPVAINSSITSSYNKNLNYYPWDTFTFFVTLKDLYWNIIKDDIKWINIDYAWTWSYKLSWIWMFQNWPLTWVKNLWKDYFEYRIQPTTNWFYEKNFKIEYYLKDNDWNPTSTINQIFLKDETDWWNIFINELWLVDDFNLKCTNKNIKLSTVCKSDNFSWCNSAKNQSQTFSSNVWAWWLTIQDKAYNQKSFSYNIQHIDKISPSISINWFNLWNTHNIKAIDTIILKISDDTAPACNNENFINYKVYDKDTPTKIYYSWKTNSWNLEINIILDILKQVWTKNLVIETSDKYWNTSNNYINFIVVPVDIPVDPIIELTPDWNKYANYSDNYTYKITIKDIYWNPIKDKEINSIKQACHNIVWCKTIKTNMTDISWSDALEIYDYIGKKTNSNWEMTFKIKSKAPWIYSQYFDIVLKNWDDQYNNTSTNLLLESSIPWIDKDFRKTYIANLNVSNDNWLSWTWSIKFGSAEKYRLNVKKTSTIDSYEVSDFKYDIKALDEDKFSVINSDINTDLEFEATINTSKSWTSVNWNLWLKTVPNPIIKYSLWWNDIFYRLTMEEDDYINSPIYIENANDFIWVKIIWILQWQWKQEITWQDKNFSDLSKQAVRDSIRKNAYKYISSVNSKTWTLNNIKYVEWNINISWDVQYETLIVKNWNVIIDWDLNTSNKKLWIIVLKDWYDITKDYLDMDSKGWNIYVTKDVKKLNAIIYADWWLISTDSSWHPYISDTVTRTRALKNQLIMNWSLFTRNTIWWAILYGWDYKLPWGKSSTDFNLAMVYDLNYVRRWKEQCIESAPLVCKYDDAAFVIIYNPIVQTNPPKLFEIK